MLVGYNTNISYKGIVFHVQTEDSGIKAPHVITLLYYKGTILARKKTSYADIASSPDYKEKVREMMKEQHKSMIKELIAGKHTPAAAPVQPAQESSEPQAGTVQAGQHQDLAPVIQQAVAVEAPPVMDPPASPESAPKKQISKSLDDILLDYILKEETE